MEWSDLRIFLAIAREGTLGAAARKLGQGQPTMGRRLRALEQSVGQTLFQRTGEGFVLTDEGTAVLSHVERMEEEALAFQRQLAG
jgi:DNA-binding transcriptional LysR family regulator